MISFTKYADNRKEIKMSDKKEHNYQFTELSVEELTRKLFDTTQLLNESNLALKRSQKQQLEMYLNVSHDLRTPLTVIKNTVEMLIQHHPETSEELDESLSFINNKLDHLNTMVNNILLITSLDSGKTQIHMETINAGHYLEDFFYQIEADELYANRKLVLDVPEDFAYEINIDPKLLAKALEELFTNALRFTTDGATITLSAAPCNSQELLITVADTGCGIPAEHLQDIFERTYMLDTSRTPDEHTGNGLGLPLVRSILSRMNANITCESNLGKGSCFTMHFPL